MNLVVELAGVALAALLSENFILVSCLGIGTRARSFQDPTDARRTGLCLTLVMFLSTFAAWLIDTLLLTRFGWTYFRLFVFALLVPSLIYGLRSFLKHCIPELYRRIDENMSSISTNCAALGCILLITQRNYGLLEALIFAFSGGIGATLVLTSFANLLQEVDLDHCPQCFRGTPIRLITAGLMALGLVGFYGLHLT